jgi:hypothetical protein
MNEYVYVFLCRYVYICIHMTMYVYMSQYVHTFLCMYTYVYICSCMYTYASMYTPNYVCTPPFNMLMLTSIYYLHNTDLKLPGRWQGTAPSIDTYFIITVNEYGGRKTPTQLYLYRRVLGEEIICRLEMLYVTAGEAWYLRLIVKNMPIYSYEDALTVNGRTYATFQHAAIAHGFVQDVDETLLCFLEAANFGDYGGDVHLTASSLRGLFCHLTLAGYPTTTIMDKAEYRSAMLLDFLHKYPHKTVTQVCLFMCVSSCMYTHVCTLMYVY